MTKPPLVSVVVSVYNGQETVESSLRSVLGQDLRDLELVVVDDGSTDETPAILDLLHAADDRVRVLRQENRGLTVSLARGCDEARGTLIARHDADDLSLPGRLSKQAARLLAEPSVALLSCFSYVMGPRNELLLEERVSADRGEATRGLKEAGRGPCGHGTAMFRAADYRKAGGYRAAFRFAQDWDLWYRLTEIGDFEAVPEFLYAFRFGERSISASRKEAQEEQRTLAIEARNARATGIPENAALERAAELSHTRLTARGAETLGTGSYFIGRSLLARRDRRAIPYLDRAVAERPIWVKARLARLAAALLCNTMGTTVDS